MRLEFIVPTAVGILMGLVGLGLLFDAWTPDEMVVARERRRRPRAERHRGGEALLGLGVLGMAAAFIGRDVWEYRTLSVIVGTVMLLWGIVLNRRYLRELITNRGALRRGAPEQVQHPESLPGEQPAPPPRDASASDVERLRIR